MSGKIPVGILGATGMVGQKFVELLADHPWFEIVFLAASEKSAGKKYSEAIHWKMASPIPSSLKNKIVQECCLKDSNRPPCQIFFSGLDSSVAGLIELNFAKAGCIVISNSSFHRMNPSIPLLIPEVNESHLELVHSQTFSGGMIVTNPNCSVIGLAMTLKPLSDLWGIEQAYIVTMQAVSGAGYPGISSVDIMDNVIPYIGGEEEKIETEPLKILGSFEKNGIVSHPMRISAQCNRVPVMDGHMACISVKLKKSCSENELIDSWEKFSGSPQKLHLPSSPDRPLIYFQDARHPQPKLHRLLEKGMAVSIGRLRKCPLLGWKFAILSHNTIRGAAGCAILNAELMLKKGFFK